MAAKSTKRSTAASKSSTSRKTAGGNTTTKRTSAAAGGSGAKRNSTAAGSGGKRNSAAAGSGGKRTSTVSAGTGKRAASAGGRTAARGNGTAAGKMVNAAERQEYANPSIYPEILLWIMLALSILLFISLLGIGGIAGEAVSSFCFGCFGVMAYPLPFLLFFLTAFLISNKRSHIAKIKAAGMGGLSIAACGLLELLMMDYADGHGIMEYYEAAARYKTGGGLVGGLLVKLFCPAIGVAGAYIMLIILAIICIVLITQRSIFGEMHKKGADMYHSAREKKQRRREQEMQRRDYEQRNPEIFTLADETNLSIFPKEPADMRLANRVAGVTNNTDLTGLTQSAPDEIRQVLPKKTEKNLDIPIVDFSIRGNGAEQGRTGAASGAYFQTLEKEDTTPTAARKTAMDRKSPMGWDIPVVGDVPVNGAAGGSAPDGPDGSAETGNRFGADDREIAKAEADGILGLEDIHIQRPEESIYEEEPEDIMENDKPGKTDASGKSGNTETSGSGKEEAHRSTKKPRASEAEIKEGIENVEQEIVQNAAAVKPKYVFPPVNLLKKPTRNRNGSTDVQLRETAQKLQQVLHTFGVNVKVTNVSCGPSVTRYELMPEMGVKVSKIVNLADDIKLNLAAADIRIEAPIPGKAAVGIEVPNKEASGVLLRELLEAEEFKNHPSNLCYAVGKDIAGKIIVSDIAKMPHLLIAGATGSGKSVFINTLIMSIIYKAKPEDVKLIMIDPKVVELSVYNGIPHLFIPVVTDPKKAAGALNWGVAEMSQRYQKFAELGVRDLKGYNAKIESIADIEDENKPEKMPQIVIIVDELADLMMVASGEVEDAICRLAQLARAAGIHLVIATQRPSVDVITGLIKANMPSRIAFSVSSGVDSRTILDMNGAEKLLGNGDMLFAPQTYKKPARIQGAFVSDKEVSDVVDFLKDKNKNAQYSQEMEAQIAQVQKSAQAAGGGGDVDELFADAGKFIIEKDKASIGMLQRWFKIGFNRAARIMDQLSDAGVVGPEEGTKPRKVLMSMEQFENYLEEN